MRVNDPHKTTTEIRQADHRKMNFTVLIVAIIVLFALLYFIYGMQPHPGAI
jgi:hypothetical protein